MSHEIAKGQSMKDDVPMDAAMQACVSLSLGLVRAILTPSRRGLIGFLAVFFVAMVCGIVAGLITSKFGASSQWQYMMTAFFTLVGQDAVKFVINFCQVRHRISCCDDDVNVTVINNNNLQSGNNAENSNKQAERIDE